MTTLLGPGVYFDRLRRNILPAASEALRGDVAGIVGIAERGPLHHAIRLDKWEDFQRVFGDPVDYAHLGYSVRGFFENGGRNCWVVRVANPDYARAARVFVTNQHRTPILRIVAVDTGTAGNQISCKIFKLGGRRFTLQLKLRDKTLETWNDLSLRPDDPRFIERIVNTCEDAVPFDEEYFATVCPVSCERDDIWTPNRNRRGSRLVQVRVAPGGETLFDPMPLGHDEQPRSQPRDQRTRPQLPFLTGGADGLQKLEPKHFYEDGFGIDALRCVRQVSVVAVPDLTPREPTVVTHEPRRPLRCTDPWDKRREALHRPSPPTNDRQRPFTDEEIRRAQLEVISASASFRRFVVLDTPNSFNQNNTTFDQLQEWRGNFDSTASKFAALYYPWLMITDEQGRPRPVPPSGHIAGVMARVETSVAIHEPPANEPIADAMSLTEEVDALTHARLNRQSVNVLTSVAGEGPRVMGGRTLARQDDRQWRYINVRRLVSLVERYAEVRLQPLVFENNSPRLRSQVRSIMNALLEEFWERGMLDGGSPREAFLVVCDQTNNPPEGAENQLVCDVQLLPPAPAEFVFVRLNQIEDQIQFTELEEQSFAVR